LTLSAKRKKIIQVNINVDSKITINQMQPEIGQRGATHARPKKKKKKKKKGKRKEIIDKNERKK
jgi:hypothetical protein